MKRGRNFLLLRVLRRMWRSLNKISAHGPTLPSEERTLPFRSPPTRTAFTPSILEVLYTK